MAAPLMTQRTVTRRVLALWCPDWPATAAAADVDLSPELPIAVLSANRVIACSASARVLGVRRGMRKRQAQSTCAEMTLVAADEHRDARFFEPVAAVVAEVAPTLEVLRPGLVVVPGDRAVRYFGSEEALSEEMVDAVSTCGVESQVGIADELFTAVLAARRGHHVEPGGDRRYLADLPIAHLALEPSLSDPTRTELVDLLRRLGITTIGAFAALSAADVATRFSADAALAHRLANAQPGRVPSGRRHPVDMAVDHVCDPPVDRVDAAAFLGRQLADALHRRLLDASTACTRLTIEATTERGQRHSRTWRCAQPLTPEATADRVRWQLEGWLTGGRGAGVKPDSPIASLRLEPVELVDAGALQYGLTGAGLPGDQDTDDRAHRSLVRIQGILGGDAVKIPVLSGGRGPAEQITMVALGDERVPQHDPSAPWPGRLPQPAPAVLVDTEIIVLDGAGQPVSVSARGAFTTEPSTIRMATVGRHPAGRAMAWEVCWWAGPWPTGTDERGIIARAQVLLDDSRALLLCYRGGGWIVEGVYE